MTKFRYHMNEYWLRLAHWAMSHVRYETRTKRMEINEISRSISAAGMANAKILINWDANTPEGPP